MSYNRKNMYNKCKYCDGTDHLSIMCFKKPRTPLSNKKIEYHKPWVDKKWIETRHRWVKKNPPIDGGYDCHYCRKFIFLDELTLDHKTPRSGLGVTQKYDLDNLVPCCVECNVRKGSIQYETFIKRFCPYLNDC